MAEQTFDGNLAELFLPKVFDAVFIHRRGQITIQDMFSFHLAMMEVPVRNGCTGLDKKLLSCLHLVTFLVSSRSAT